MNATQAAGFRSAGLQIMLKELGTSLPSPQSMDGAASSSATIHHVSPRQSRAARPASAQQRLKRGSPAGSNSSEEAKVRPSKAAVWKRKEGRLHSDGGKVRPASAEGFFRGQQKPVRMTMSPSPRLLASPTRSHAAGGHGRLLEVRQGAALCAETLFGAGFFLGKYETCALTVLIGRQ